ncbi:SgcJ/EcaC family oxidoreductase [Microvirga sp. TS319]|uniref:SgcJ/EcaC family oxidoreductase n=1 Tax=Microvirga sp. TS319 TaxID=3241165 RepID=UPI00351A20AD
MHPTTKQTAIEAEDEAAIRSLADSLVTAWNAGDGIAYGRAFTVDCDYVTFNGQHVHGREAVAASHQALFDTHLHGSKLIFESLHMRPLGDGTVLVHGIGNSLLKGQRKLRKSRRSIQTFVAVRTETGWLFTAFHNTRIFKITPFRALLMLLGL